MNIKRFLQFFLLCFSISLFIPSHIALADTGPKPSMEFTFTGEDVTIVSGTLYECRQSDCSDATVLDEVGPQGFRCEPTSCSAIGYGFAPYHKIKIEFSDGVTRESNIFETAGFDSKYKVTVQPQDLLVEKQFSLGIGPRMGFLLLACVCLLIAGALVLGVGIFIFKRRKTN